jgi:dienelactone hydrolase
MGLQPRVSLMRLMRANAMVICAALGSPLLPQGVEAQVVADRWTRAATDFIGHMRAGDFQAAAAMVSPSVPAGTFSADKLSGIWGQLTAQVGELGGLEPTKVAMQDSLHVIDMAGRFVRQPLLVRVVVTPDERVSGLWFLPPAPPAYEMPAYVDESAFSEADITVGGEWKLPGKLTLPKADGRVPAVVLVHGSGPNDMDEAIGPNRPFRDLAWGLASKGIAVLRYDKRTRVHGAKMVAAGPVTLEAETIDDALEALALARSRPEVDPARVYVLGHSLGGMAAPAIAKRDGKLAGAIMLAGPARPLSTVLDEQLAYIDSLAVASGGEATQRATREAIAKVLTRSLAPDATVMGAPVSYFYALDALDQVATAKSLSVPFLVLQGGRDYQVTMQDFALWKAALAAHPGTKLVAYPDLNRLFIAGTGKATPSEYMSKPGHVAPEVIEEIARWIRR